MVSKHSLSLYLLNLDERKGSHRAQSVLVDNGRRCVQGEISHACELRVHEIPTGALSSWPHSGRITACTHL